MHYQNHLARLHEVPYVMDNPGRESARVVPSTSNTRAEYQWRFLNQGVTRPMLLTLDTMFANHDFDLGNDVHKFCVATAACSIANVLIDRLFGQLVNRRIDRVGRPKQVMKNQFNTMPLIPGSLLDTGAAAAEYIAQGGSIIPEMELRDPLSEWPELQAERKTRLDDNHNLDMIASEIVRPFHPTHSPLFRQYILDFISTTVALLGTV
ncbi:hypothetical protein BCR44DRAFT_263631 [Catenaria anguillulae PL171]|uniref:Uncharacterized protein n=1 Tax=Catenaria anguillulae PL171 TaxID=765915 RepID=A0A1Y2H9Y2_9FUNG|nr:hypothetical protein BCR44DRAFT_1289853 [Catenaria anguillulae PL171]ORZ38632.1 hypothetical protein BCR44DRAFT_263631 [Catenaria anguillulae PL171]